MQSSFEFSFCSFGRFPIVPKVGFESPLEEDFYYFDLGDFFLALPIWIRFGLFLPGLACTGGAAAWGSFPSCASVCPCEVGGFNPSRTSLSKRLTSFPWLFPTFPTRLVFLSSLSPQLLFFQVDPLFAQFWKTPQFPSKSEILVGAHTCLFFNFFPSFAPDWTSWPIIRGTSDFSSFFLTFCCFDHIPLINGRKGPGTASRNFLFFFFCVSYPSTLPASWPQTLHRPELHHRCFGTPAHHDIPQAADPLPSLPPLKTPPQNAVCGSLPSF